MDLLDALSPEHRQRLMRCAEPLRLAPGELLLRRGEAGGDLFRLDVGTLEVIDARREPPVVLAVVGHGAMLGEMAFIDGSVRSADVRAAEECVCQHWRREELLEILESEPALGLAFYRALTDLVTEHSRNVRAITLDGRSAGRGSSPSEQWCDDLVAQLRRRLLAVEPTLRTHGDGARAEVLAALDTLLEGLIPVAEKLAVHERPAVLARVEEQLRPWLIRSQLGELVMAPPTGATDDTLVLRHMLGGTPQGDGELGVLLDEWLLQRPTSRGLQQRAQALQASVIAARPSHALLVNGGPSGLGAHLEQALPGVRLATLDGPELTAWVLGDSQPSLDGQPLVVVDGLLDSLPDRVAAPALASIRSWLAPGGAVLGTSLLPASDAHLFRYVLGWPQVHRRVDGLAHLLASVGLTSFEAMAHGTGLVWSASA